MPKHRSTQNDVARLAGVTRGTVSLVLSQRADSPSMVPDIRPSRVRINQKRVGELAVQGVESLSFSGIES